MNADKHGWDWEFSDCGYLYDDDGGLADEYCYFLGGYEIEK